MSEIEVYQSFENVPLDDEPAFEWDDSTPIEERTDNGMFTFSNELETPTVYKLIVPYPGYLEEHSHGFAVNGIKRIVHRYDGTLAALKATPIGARRRWGVFFTMKLKRAQKRIGVRVTGVWDRDTHRAFAPYADAYAIALINSAWKPDPTPQEIQQNALTSFLMAFYNRRYNIRYSQLRPSQLLPVMKLTRADCSGSIACGMDTAKVMPHGDWRWTNTDTQIFFGKAVTFLGDVEVGDVAFYGHGSNPSHETCVVSNEPHDVRVFSMGTYPARILPIDYDRGRLGGRIALRRFIT